MSQYVRKVPGPLSESTERERDKIKRNSFCRVLTSSRISGSYILFQIFSPLSLETETFHVLKYLLKHICEYVSNNWFYSSVQLCDTRASSPVQLSSYITSQKEVKKSEIRRTSWLIDESPSTNPRIWRLAIQQFSLCPTLMRRGAISFKINTWRQIWYLWYDNLFSKWR